MIPEDGLSDKGMRYVNYGNFFLGIVFLFFITKFFNQYTAYAGALGIFGLMYCYMKAWDEVKMEYFDRARDIQ